MPAGSIVLARKGKRGYTSSKGNVRLTPYKSVTRRTKKKGKKMLSVPKWRPVASLNKDQFKLTYSDTKFAVPMLVGTGYLYNYTFRGSSIYDPDMTGVGVAPYGYSQLFGPGKFYGKYTVVASKITLYPYYIGADAGNNIRNTVLSIFPMQSANVTYEGIDDISRIPYKKQIAFKCLDDLSKSRKVSSYMSYKKMTGQDPQDNVRVYNDNPVEGNFYWIVKWSNANAAVDLNMYYDVKIDYYVQAWKTDNINES